MRSGAYATTSESVLMELIRGKDHPSFKAISTILKETKDRTRSSRFRELVARARARVIMPTESGL